ncbi:MAG: C13 family peptidase [Alphaproteobacteria bacterium]|nr:C13 family peptidase [Alphaproteobacteria bacterium]MBU1525810.1 C13 family peptidase [Alphaproteobacteria bacterium]MBU2118128.1 C13 family peptidase [Alphaproteobacteria bacterium]MBU2350027.1 C13 family peptidase [Alphaproteobacteria bacterium]MBU2383228.1 C13 family peptidase [Alphaproteobacteria bacterium]
MIRTLAVAAVATLTLTACATTPGAADPGGTFDGWTGAVVAADWRTSRGDPIVAFDNSRRDLTAAFKAEGFEARHFVDYTLRPTAADGATGAEVLSGITEVARRATVGCFLYFSSHGNTRGITWGNEGQLSPSRLGELVDQWCGERPTVVVVSACFSGVFIPELQGPNRMIMTAARRDRSSFGCSQDAVYPYFDGCVLESLPNAADFINLAEMTRACVSRRETAEGLRPASEPQVFVGGDIRPLLTTTYAFRR